MFGKKEESKEIKAFIGKDCKFEGKFIFSGSVKLDGKFIGEINGKEGTLIVGETSEIKGIIEVNTIINRGKITGEIKAEKVENFYPGFIEGNIETKFLFNQNEAIINGEIKMLERESSSNSEKIKKLEV